MNIWQRWKQTALHNKALVLSSVLMALGTLFYASAAIFQLWMMDVSSKHTDEQIGRVIGNLNWLARSMDESQEASQQAIEANNRQSGRALNATITNAHDAERAWLTVSAFKLSGEPSPDKPVTVEVQIINTGKTPALKVGGDFKLFLGVLNDIKPRQFTQSAFNKQAILAPGPYGESVSSEQLYVNKAQATGYSLKGSVIFIEGIIWYKDTFNRPHWTKVCAWHGTGMTPNQFVYYWLGNEIDENGQHQP